LKDPDLLEELNTARRIAEKPPDLPLVIAVVSFAQKVEIVTTPKRAPVG